MKCCPRCAARTPERHNRFDDWIAPPATMIAVSRGHAEALPALGTVAAEVSVHGERAPAAPLDAIDARAGHDPAAVGDGAAQRRHRRRLLGLVRAAVQAAPRAAAAAFRSDG